MRKLLTILIGLIAAACATPAAPPTPDFGYVSQQLAVKALFGKQQEAAIAQPFVGIRTTKGIQPGLFPVHATGVSTEPVRKAAESFLATLTPDQMIRTVFDVQDSEWRRWFNVDNGIYVRQGVSLKEMSTAQRAAAMQVMQTSLSADGFALTEAIRKTDQTLREIGRASCRERVFVGV